MPFWSKNRDSNPSDPEKYFPRAKKRLDLVVKEMSKVDRLVGRENPDVQSIAACAVRLRTLTEEQRYEVVHHPALEKHKTSYFRMMDLETRKVEDLLATGGANFEALIAEQDAYHQQMAENLAAGNREFEDFMRALGQAPRRR